MTTRTIVQALNDYQASRLQFVKTISELASKSHNVKPLKTAGVLDLLRPLLLDIVPTIQHTAIIALGKLANNDKNMSHAIVEMDVISYLLRDIDKQNDLYKKSVLLLLRSIAKHSAELAQAVIDNGGLTAMITCSDDFHARVKEAAVWAIGYISRHNQQLAKVVVDAGAVPQLILCLQEPELYLKQISASALCDISKHSQELGQSVAEAGAIAFLAKSLANPDIKLKRQILLTLSSITKHSFDLAESVIEAQILSVVLRFLTHANSNIQQASATLIQEICKHGHELSQVVVRSGGVNCLMELIKTSNSLSKLPAIAALGYIAAHSDELATVIIESNGAILVSSLLNEEVDNDTIAVLVWTAGQIGKHSPYHAKAIADTNLLPRLLSLYCNPSSPEDVKKKAKFSLKSILRNCVYFAALEPLINNAPLDIMKYVLKQMSKILPHDPKARRIFVTNGGLKKIQEIEAIPSTAIYEYIRIIYSCFPEEIVRYYSPDFSDIILEKVEQFEPNIDINVEHVSKQLSESSDSSLSINHDD